MQPRSGKPTSDQTSRPRRELPERVEACLKQLANGFLRYPANDTLRRQMTDGSTSGESSPERFFRQLIVVVNQLLIFLVGEDRGLRKTKVAELRQLIEQPHRFNEQDDLWLMLPDLWEPDFFRGTAPGLLDGPPQSGVRRIVDEWLSAPPLGGCSISNRDLLTAFAHIAWYDEGDEGPVSYSSMDIEELGSAYERLLELHPVIAADAGVTSGQELRLELVAGSQRKNTGSYYTPPELIEALIESTLKPMVDQRLAAARRVSTSQADAERAILSIRICDPACGTGHFLLAAARYLGKELARVRTGTDDPGELAIAAAVTDVTARCIYGVDQDPLAVKLCRIVLWLEGQPTNRWLTMFADRIGIGDALVGVPDLGVLHSGIPDQAFQADDAENRTLARRLKTANRVECERLSGDRQAKNRLAARENQRSKAANKPLKQACDLWTAAFFQPLCDDKPAITTAVLADCLADRAVDAGPLKETRQIAARQRFFHWPLEFAQVFAAGGFDVVLGNPPWLSYTGRHKVDIAPAHLAFLTTRFPAIRSWPCAHAAFLLLARDLLRPGGRLGLVLPRQLADLDSFEPVRQSIAADMRLVGSVRDVGEDAFTGVTQPVALYCLERSGPGESVWPIEHLSVGNGAAPYTNTAARSLPEPLASLLAWCETQPKFPPRTFSDPGVHTGNVSKKIVLNEPHGDSSDSQFEPIREGKDIAAFHVAAPRKWVWLDPQLAEGEYCRIRPGDLYRGTPIVLRQTANRPIAARHVQPTYFRNSVLACQGLPNIPGRVLVGFLNSSLYAFLHQARFKDPGQRAFPQVKIKHLHSLPQPPLAALEANGGTLMQQLETIVAEIERAAAQGERPATLFDQLDALVLRAFDLPEDLVSLLRDHLA